MSDRKGYFEEADKGTIFLDEIGELPLSTQVRLLRVLEAGEFMKVGSSKVLKTNVRVVAATNVNLEKAIKEGKFREDLFYRLNSVPIRIPPLRDRVEDVYLLFRKFANDFADRYRMPPIKLTEDAKELLMRYRWPGNIRQLKNITEQISVIEQNREIDAESLRPYIPYHDGDSLPALIGSVHGNVDQNTFNTEREILYKVLFDMKKDMNDLKKLVLDILQDGNQQDISHEHAQIIQKLYQTAEGEFIKPSKPSPAPQYVTPSPADHTIEDMEEFVEESLSLADKEKELILKALEKYNGKRKLAAQELGISERTLYRKIKEFEIDD